jgi:hypothetical protein
VALGRITRMPLIRGDFWLSQWITPYKRVRSGNTGRYGRFWVSPEDNTHVNQGGNAVLTVKGTDHTHGYSGTTSDESSLPPVTRIYFIEKIA